MKLKNYRTFIVLGICFILGIFTSNYIVYSIFDNVVNKVETGGLVAKFNPYDFTRTWQSTSYTTGFLLIIPALIIIIIVTNEFAFRTNRQNILDGWSRQDFINVKLAVAIIIAIISTLLVVVSALIFGFASGTTFSFEGVSHVGYFFLKALSYNLLAVLLSVWVRRTGFAIGLYFIYMGAENIVSQLLDVWSVHLRNKKKIDLGSMGDYLPMNASDGLLTFPNNPFKTIVKSKLPTDFTEIVVIMIIVYLILFLFFSTRRMIKSDL